MNILFYSQTIRYFDKAGKDDSTQTKRKNNDKISKHSKGVKKKEKKHITTNIAGDVITYKVNLKKKPKVRRAVEKQTAQVSL